jgi:hypothetical protein
MPLSQNVYRGNELTEAPGVFRFRIREGLLSAISVGFFFLLIGAIFVITPNLFNEVEAFFRDFETQSIPHLSNVFLPAPANPAAHTVVYTAVWQFSLVWGVFQIIILALRFVAGSPFSKKAETAGNMVFWLGTAYLVGALPTTGLEEWFVFWAAIIMLIGVSLIVRAVILAARLAFS